MAFMVLPLTASSAALAFIASFAGGLAVEFGVVDYGAVANLVGVFETCL